MAYEAILREEARWRCNCRLELADQAGQSRTVVAGAWDCPSHGRDKRRSIAAMCDAAGAYWEFTGTFRQPRAYSRSGEALTPRGFERCNPRTHVYDHTPYKGGRAVKRWRVMPDCDHCLKRVSRHLELFVKRVRYHFPDAQYLRVFETHPRSGALHVHFGVAGLPKVLSRKDRDVLRRSWQLLSQTGKNSRLPGGGFFDVRKPPKWLRDRAPGRGLGWYLGKYLAKRQDKLPARRRRWVRSRLFAPEVLMAWSQKEREARQGDAGRSAAEAVRSPGDWSKVGWWHPILPVLSPVRIWMPD